MSRARAVRDRLDASFDKMIQDIELSRMEDSAAAMSIQMAIARHLTEVAIQVAALHDTIEKWRS